MIKVSTGDPAFQEAYRKAHVALPVLALELPREYGQRWREAYRCRVEPGEEFPHSYYVFDRDEDYTWFMMRWA
jgi:hypothetical protein